MLKKLFSLASGGSSTEVEHLSHHPEVNGLSSAANAGTKYEKENSDVIGYQR